MSVRVTEYTVVKAKSKELHFAVAGMLEYGWQPLGAPTFVLMGNPAYTQWVEGFQAMVKTEDSDK